MASPADTTAYGSALTEAATRAATVDAASSWSASSTSAASSTPTRPGSGSAVDSPSHRRAAIRPAAGAGPGATRGGGGSRPGRRSGTGRRRSRPRGGAPGAARPRRPGRPRSPGSAPAAAPSPGGRPGPGDQPPGRPRPPARAAGRARRGGSGNRPVQSHSATSSKLRVPARSVTATPRYQGRPWSMAVRAEGHDQVGGRPAAPPGTAGAGEPVDLGRVEGAGPPVGGALATQQPAAHVRVQGRRLDAQPRGRLRGAQRRSPARHHIDQY